MLAAFDLSGHVRHSPTKGTVRENDLRKFLSEGRLPSKYGLGSGEVVGRVRDETSRQCDIIIYDKLNGVALLADENTQIFPIDCVYGIIEVKSSLSKPEFLDALEKIKLFKMMSPTGSTAQGLARGWTITQPRPKPFGMVFAYSLSGNSLDSLLANLKDWEEGNSPTLWPNYVCVLGEGVIHHNGPEFSTAIISEEITADTWPSTLKFGEDSLFKFFCAIHDTCSQMTLGPVELYKYFEPSIRVGKYILEGRAAEVTITTTGKRARLKEVVLDQIVAWCQESGQISYGEVLIKRLGSLPLGTENWSSNKAMVFLFNPDNLPGLGELRGDPIIKMEFGFTAVRSLLNALEISINGDHYVIATDSLEDGAFEEI